MLILERDGSLLGADRGRAGPAPAQGGAPPDAAHAATIIDRILDMAVALLRLEQADWRFGDAG